MDSFDMCVAFAAKEAEMCSLCPWLQKVKNGKSLDVYICLCWRSAKPGNFPIHVLELTPNVDH